MAEARVTPSLAGALANDGHEAGRQILAAERGTEGRVDAIPSKQFRNVRGVNEDIVVAFIVAPPCTIVATDERCHLANKSVWRRNGEPGHEYPLVVDRCKGRRIASGFTPMEIADVEREDSTRSEGAADCTESTPDGRLVGEITQNVTDRHIASAAGIGSSGRTSRRIFHIRRLTARQLEHCW